MSSGQETETMKTSSMEVEHRSLASTLQAGASTAITTGTNWLNTVLPSEKREEIKERTTRFASDRPYLATFLLSQIVISGFPICLFIVMAITVTISAITTGLLLGLLGALFFILGSIGFALVFLLPTLFFTTFAAVGIWFWCMGAYYIIKFFDQKDWSNRHHSMSDDRKLYEHQIDPDEKLRLTLENRSI